MLPVLVVADTTKVRIFKQITTGEPHRYTFGSCCWYHKGTNFQANHNHVPWTMAIRLVVADTTKVRIFKQITTAWWTARFKAQLLLIPQRYEFSSKSQPNFDTLAKVLRCCWYHKGTNFQANHNTAKVIGVMSLLLLIPQRYEFSSKSQPPHSMHLYLDSCCWYHKGTNFQANHNCIWCTRIRSVVVADTTKVRIFKQITTEPCHL